DFAHLCCNAAQTVGELPAKAARISSDQIISERRGEYKSLKLLSLRSSPSLAWSLIEGGGGNRSQAIVRRRPPRGFEISNAAGSDRFGGPWERLVRLAQRSRSSAQR